MCRFVSVLGFSAWLIGCTASLVAPNDPGREVHGTTLHQSAHASDIGGSVGLPGEPGHHGDPFFELQVRFEGSKAKSVQRGTASYYADSLAGNRMANGEVYDPSQPTMAHRTLPFGTVVRITRLSTGARLVLRVTDRGPFGKKRRIADLSKEAARRLDMLRDGVVDIQLEVLGHVRSSQR